MKQPEETVIQQNDKGDFFYIISKGECECFVRDEMRQEHLVKTLLPGMYVGEIALLTGGLRTASILTKNYTTIGAVSQHSFEDMLTNYTYIRKAFYEHMYEY